MITTPQEIIDEIKGLYEVAENTSIPKISTHFSNACRYYNLSGVVFNRITTVLSVDENGYADIPQAMGKLIKIGRCIDGVFYSLSRGSVCKVVCGCENEEHVEDTNTGDCSCSKCGGYTGSYFYNLGVYDGDSWRIDYLKTYGGHDNTSCAGTYELHQDLSGNGYITFDSKVHKQKVILEFEPNLSLTASIPIDNNLKQALIYKTLELLCAATLKYVGMAGMYQLKAAEFYTVYWRDYMFKNVTIHDWAQAVMDNKRITKI